MKFKPEKVSKIHLILVWELFFRFALRTHNKFLKVWELISGKAGFNEALPESRGGSSGLLGIGAA